MTNHMYLQHPKLFETSAIITSIDSDNKGWYLTLDRSLFYPQGGGQPADKGKILVDYNTHNIYDVRNIDGEIRHYIDLKYPIDIKNKSVEIFVDRQCRELNTRYHTAGHLIASIGEKLSSNIVAIKGHQFPSEAYVEFNGILSDTIAFMNQLKTEINNKLNCDVLVETKALNTKQIKVLAKNLPEPLQKNKILRVCHIEGFSPVPCGGTHVNNLKEIGSITILKCKSKKNKTNIFYEVGE